jgi:predicted PurR-regulated permease PerM
MNDVPAKEQDQADREHLMATWLELTIRLGVLALLLYWAFFLIRPFITIAIWSIVLTVALYPVYHWLVGRLGGRRRLAAALLTIFNLLIVIGPATWLVLGLVDSLRTLTGQLDLSVLALPPPPVAVKSWPFVGEPLYQFWDLASTNLQAALIKIAPQLAPLGGALVQIAADAGTGIVKFFIAIVAAGFLFPPAPALADALRAFARSVAAERGEKFVRIAGTTLRAISRGVIGISVLQALLAGLGFVAIGLPAASLITSIVLILGIIQIGPSVVLVPLVIWSWFAKDTTTALLFTAYMIPVSLLDNVLRPLVLGRGLETPMLIILIGVVGGTLSYGITGLFLGPIVLAVIWDLLIAWINEHGSARSSSPSLQRETRER